MTDKEQDALKIIDTSNALTKEELQELKRLASMSKMMKLIFSVVFSIIMLVGADHLVEWLKDRN
jgi:Na+-driven multidrug efflux pump